jgi:hypothetical protein
MESSNQRAGIDTLPCELHYELCYRSLNVQGRGYAFPCDAAGHVDLDQLSERLRESYCFARAMVGFELLSPQVCRAH